MSRAGHEMSHWAEYDYVVVNSSLDTAYEKIELILQAERLRRERQMWLSGFVRKLQKELEK
jgi:guanylate kinase